jgi:hypothetical protein
MEGYHSDEEHQVRQVLGLPKSRRRGDEQGMFFRFLMLPHIPMTTFLFAKPNNLYSDLFCTEKAGILL